jgi:triacylglycerol lipase
MNIVLAHGILGFNTVLGIEYFNGIKEHLEKKFNAKVLATKVDPVKSIKDRGVELRNQILVALGKTGTVPTLNPKENVHIIAHSMGGLDSRLILSPRNPDNIANVVGSLTTVGTPHNGSPVADLCVSFVGGKSPIPAVGTIERKIKDSIQDLGKLLDGLRDLTTTSATNFNKDNIDNPGVRYFCVAGQGRRFSLTRLLRLDFAKTSLFLLPFHEYMKLETGEENDGVVAITSAQRSGWKVISDPWPVDHFEEVGHNIDRGPTGTPTVFDYLRGYENIIESVR